MTLIIKQPLLRMSYLLTSCIWVVHQNESVGEEPGLSVRWSDVRSGGNGYTLITNKARNACEAHNTMIAETWRKGALGLSHMNWIVSHRPQWAIYQGSRPIAFRFHARIAKARVVDSHENLLPFHRRPWSITFTNKPWVNSFLLVRWWTVHEALCLVQN